jgi:DNA-binding HxlR family transcriptional regulator
MNDQLESLSDQKLTHQDSSDCVQAADFIRGASLLQEKWVLLIVYSLLGGPTGFSELVRRGNVNTTTMTQRLNLLEAAGVLVKTVHSTMPPRTSYELTDSGRALKPILDAIASWSAEHLKETRFEECPSMTE